jgi:hypothetical protein
MRMKWINLEEREGKRSQSWLKIPGLSWRPVAYAGNASYLRVWEITVQDQPRQKC